MKVSLVVFTLNELGGMKAVMPQIKKDWYDELLVIDGGSSDGTIEYARECGYGVYIQSQKGLGAAFDEAMRRVKGEIIITFSPDGNSLPEEIPELTKKIEEGFDIAVASRYLLSAKSYDDDPLTAFGNWMFTRLVNFLFGAKYTDLLVIFRAFRQDAVGRLNIHTRTPSWTSLMLIRAAKKKLKVTEIAADEPKRIGGRRKMNPLINGCCELFIILKEFLSGAGKN